MSHNPIQLHNLGVRFSHKLCFENFYAQINNGDRIAIIGRNGAGKSSLLKILEGGFQATSGDIKRPNTLKIGYIPQIIQEFGTLSGGQRFNQAFEEVMRNNPDMLLLDEPTNHLDQHHRQLLMRKLKAFSGTLIMISHDVTLLRHAIDTLWHIDEKKIYIFSGNYDDYQREFDIKRLSVLQELSYLNRQKKERHQALMKEQERAKKSDLKGEKSIRNRKWPTMVSDEKARRAIETSGKRKREIRTQRDQLIERLAELRLPEIIVPKFSLPAHHSKDQTLVSIHNGIIGYKKDHPLLQNIHLSLQSHDRLVLIGHNGSGKTTLIKAIFKDLKIITLGDWHLPKAETIGYLDQHYSTLISNETVFETIAKLRLFWTQAQVRHHLNDFLFRKNEEVNAQVKQLSGGERARLSLAQIAAKTPRLLLLDEITNNLDLETREHVIQVLKYYPGAMIVISHDEDFLKDIAVNCHYNLG